MGLQPHEAARVDAIKARLYAAGVPFCQQDHYSLAERQPGPMGAAETPSFDPLPSQPSPNLAFSMANGRPPVLATTASESETEPTEADSATRNCAFPVYLSGRRTVAATTNGLRIRINRGMINFFDDDAELAFVLAHEMSHMILGHHDQLKEVSRRELELEADYLGLYILARAGYDLPTALQGIHRLYRTYTSEMINHPSYPPAAMRFAALGVYHEEIRAKLERGEQLLPDARAYQAYKVLRLEASL